MEQITLNKVNESVEKLHKDMELMKNIMVTLQEFIEDSFLSAEEEGLFNEYIEDKKKKKLVTSEDLRDELGL